MTVTGLLVCLITFEQTSVRLFGARGAFLFRFEAVFANLKLNEATFQAWDEY
jgi:hypothetical protein